MARRRPKGTGAVRELPSGRWQARIDNGVACSRPGGRIDDMNTAVLGVDDAGRDPGLEQVDRRHEEVAAKAGRIVMIVLGSLLALIGFALLAGGTAGLIGYATQRTNGYFQTGEVRLTSATYAITSDRVDLQSDWVTPTGRLIGARLAVSD
jgi:hypothetical protein